MRVTPHIFTSALAAAALGALLASCSSDTGPKAGTPAFYWSVAKETYRAGDYVKTTEHLDKIVATENEFKSRALPWLLVLTSGMARGYADLADGFDAGIRAKKGDPGGFRKHMVNYRSQAGRHSLQLAEAFLRFQKSKDEAVTLAFPYPTGSAVAVPELTKASMGGMLQGSEIEAAQRRALQRGVLLATCRAAGAADDTAKTMEMFKAGDVQVPRATFMLAVAQSLYDLSQMYAPRKGNDPEKMKMFGQQASNALKTIPASAQTKELLTKIEKTTAKK